MSTQIEQAKALLRAGKPEELASCLYRVAAKIADELHEAGGDADFSPEELAGVLLAANFIKNIRQKDE